MPSGKIKKRLDWHLMEYPFHKGIFDYVKSLNDFYRENGELYELDHEPEGFEWIDPHNIDQSVIAFRRRGKKPGDELIVVCNFTPNVYFDYKVGVPEPGIYKEVFNSDSSIYGGSGQINEGKHFSFPEKWQGSPQHIKLKVPPLAISIFKKEETTSRLKEADE